MTDTATTVPRDLKPCPFCGDTPELPDGDGTQYEIECAGCGQAMASVQICDLMTLEERVADAFTDYRYGEEFVERAKVQAIEHWNNRAPSPAGADGLDGLDERMRAAGMLSAAELIAGAPLDAFMKHAGVNDLETFGQWLEMRRGECLRMQGRYDLGERDKSDDMYEWTVAHSAVFGEAHVNFKDALAGNQAIIDGLEGLLREAYSFLPSAFTDLLSRIDAALSAAGGK